jgi:hypothetical protein
LGWGGDVAGGDVYDDRSTIKRDMEQIWAYHKAAFFLALGLAFVFGLVLVSVPPVSLYVRAMQQWQRDREKHAHVRLHLPIHIHIYTYTYVNRGGGGGQKDERPKGRETKKRAQHADCSREISKAVRWCCTGRPGSYTGAD